MLGDLPAGAEPVRHGATRIGLTSGGSMGFPGMLSYGAAMACPPDFRAALGARARRRYVELPRHLIRGVKLTYLTFAPEDGRRLSYQRRGSGPLVVCIPGGPGMDPEAYFAELELPGHQLLVFAPRVPASRARPRPGAGSSFVATSSPIAGTASDARSRPSPTPGDVTASAP